MTSYPEHEKLKAISDKSQEIGQFLEWMQGEGWHFCKIEEQEEDEYTWGSGYRFNPQYLDITKTLTEYFHIDLDKIEAEKRAMLDELSQLGQEQE